MTTEFGDQGSMASGSESTEEFPDSLPGSEAVIDSAKLTLLFNASKALAVTTDLDQLLNVIVAEVRKVLECDGAGVALYDEEKDDFYWRIIQDKGSLLASARDEIRIPKDKGVCGWVFETGRPALVHDAANDPRLYRPVEDKSGFTTRNMICVPLKTRENSMGVLYALNKVADSFNGDDVEILAALSGNVALAMENASRYEDLMKSHKELERLNLVKNRILNHLSHELKTPLAIIEASLKIMQRKLKIEGLVADRFPFERIFRNLDRLKIVEKQVGHIVEEKEYPQRETVSAFLDNLSDLLDIQSEEEPWLADAIDALKRKMDELFPRKIEKQEGVAVTAAFQAAQSRVELMTSDRTLDIEFEPPEPVMIRMQPQIMMSVIGGVIRNAVENTPDQGKIVIRGEKVESGYRITIRDHGVGIPEGEQANIFEGFYPVQQADLYSSGSRYAFNAGGTGTDLLKIKIFSERFGFKIRFKSTRCSCIPTVRDTCPGVISKCSCCEKVEDCLNNGGTEFVIEIPSELVESQGILP